MTGARRRILVIGAGGLGCPALYALAPKLAERGDTVAIADDDRVDVSNLHRQILHRTEDVGRYKVDSAREALGRRWPSLTVETQRVRVGAGNVHELLRGHDVILDGTDSFESKFLLNDACVQARLPLVHGGVTRWSGQLMAVVPGHACYRCLFEAPPPEGAAASCQEAGILGAVAGVIGARMADEALAILDGKPTRAGVLQVYDARSGESRKVRLRPRPSCAACGTRTEAFAS